MIKTFEEFNSKMLCESKSKFIKKELIYSDNPKYKNDCICKTWEDVVKLFSHPKYNVQCVLSRKGYGSWMTGEDVTVLDAIEGNAEYGDYITITIEKLYSEEYNAILIQKNYKEHDEESYEYIFPLNDKGITYMSKQERHFGSDLNDDVSRYFINIEYDIFDVFNLIDNKYIKKIKSVKTKKEIDSILDKAFKALTREQYSVILSAALCREIELELWEPIYNGETIIQDLSDKFGFEYFTEN